MMLALPYSPLCFPFFWCLIFRSLLYIPFQRYGWVATSCQLLIFCCFRILFVNCLPIGAGGHAGNHRQLLPDSFAQWNPLARWGNALLLSSNHMVLLSTFKTVGIRITNFWKHLNIIFFTGSVFRCSSGFFSYLSIWIVIQLFGTLLY